MIFLLAGVIGFAASLIAHDLAAQVLADLPLRPLRGTCPACGTGRGWMASRCPECGRRVAREWVLAALATAVAIGFAHTLGSVWALGAFLVFLCLTMALGITDLDSLRIVDRLNLPGTVIVIALLGLASLADGNPSAFGRGLLGGLVYFLGANLVFLAVGGRGFGYGDVKLAAQLGVFTAYVSWGTIGWAVLSTAFLGGVIAVIVVVVGMSRRAGQRRKAAAATTVRDTMKQELPYGPAMILGAWLAITLAGLGVFAVPT